MGADKQVLERQETRTFVLNKWMKGNTPMWYISAYYGEYKDNLSFANLTYYDRKTKKEAMADFEKLRVEPVR